MLGRHDRTVLQQMMAPEKFATSKNGSTAAKTLAEAPRLGLGALPSLQRVGERAVAGTACIWHASPCHRMPSAIHDG